MGPSDPSGPSAFKAAGGLSTTLATSSYPLKGKVTPLTTAVLANSAASGFAYPIVATTLPGENVTTLISSLMVSLIDFSNASLSVVSKSKSKLIDKKAYSK